jgi:hypothetical protein
LLSAAPSASQAERARSFFSGTPCKLTLGGRLCVQCASWAAFSRATWTVEGGDLGGFGGDQLEHSRQWQGAQWAGLFLGVPS